VPANGSWIIDGQAIGHVNSVSCFALDLPSCSVSASSIPVIVQAELHGWNGDCESALDGP
jgi:hypothetical protein